MYFKTKFQQIPLSSINQEDTLFCFADKDPSYFNVLKLSIAKIGITNPIVVQPLSPGKYRVINGFKRLQIARELNFSSLPVCILRENLSIFEVLTVLFLSHPQPLSFGEKVRIIGIMSQLGLSSSQICNNFSSFLGIDSSFVCESYIRISHYRPHLLSYIFSHNFSLKQALIIEGLSFKEQDTLVSLASCLSLKGYDFLNILIDLKEIATREGKSVYEVIESTGILDIGKDVKLTRSQKIDSIKKTLKERRYPCLTKVNRELDKLRREIQSSSGLKFIWDEGLEGKVKAFIEITHTDDVKKVVANLSNEDNLALLSKFLEVYYEGLQDKKDTDR